MASPPSSILAAAQRRPRGVRARAAAVGVSVPWPMTSMVAAVKGMKLRGSALSGASSTWYVSLRQSNGREIHFLLTPFRTKET